MMSLKPHIITALAYFFVAAFLGLVLRFFMVLELPITYKFFVHAHSHIALLGWVYLALTTLIYKLFIQQKRHDKNYRVIFWCTQVTLVGMLLSFPFQGYALFSIIFSTAFLFASYAFFWMFLRKTELGVRQKQSYQVMRAALWYMVLSSIGPWALGGIMSILGPESVWYRLAIYFYLHFQYNGWMILALVALFFYVLEQKDIPVAPKFFKRFFWLLNWGIVASFFLSTLFAEPHLLFYGIGGFGALLQLLAFILLWIELGALKNGGRHNFKPMELLLFRITIFCIMIKMLMQLVSALPYVARIASTYLDFVIGYLHWTFLGVLTFGIFFFLHFFRFIVLKKWVVLGYLLGFFATEVLLFYRAMAGWQGRAIINGYPKVLATASMFIVLALGVIFFASILTAKSDEKGKAME
ncbi:hypothetical protein ACFQZJ_07375 [Maribacter chungangensis]|uniref:Uncharacterized protein n=1 Tax=Maribacter chungangensis TaxID=1069117 RepID=A0ABW3B2I0_9FLAO